MKKSVLDTAFRLVVTAKDIKKIIIEAYPIDLNTEDKAEVLELLAKVNYQSKILKEEI